MSTFSTFRKPSRLARLGASLILVSLLATACGSDSVVGGSIEAVSVGEDSLSRADLEAILSGAVGEDAGATGDPAETARFLSNWLFITALGQEIEANGFNVTQEFRDDATSQLEGQEGLDLDTPYGQSAIGQRAIQLAAEPYVANLMSESAVELLVPEYLCSSHILLASLEDANVVVDRLAAGEDFAALAAEVSTGPSGPRGGDLGCVDTRTFIGEFVEGAREVAPAGLTGPVQSQFGFHVIAVRSMGPLSAENHPEIAQGVIDSAMESANADTQELLRDQVVQSIIDASNDRLVDSAQVDPRYGAWALGLGVTPPSGITPAG